MCFGALGKETNGGRRRGGSLVQDDATRMASSCRSITITIESDRLAGKRSESAEAIGLNSFDWRRNGR